MVEIQKVKALAANFNHKARGRITLYSKKKEKSDIGNDTNLDKANHKYLL